MISPKSFADLLEATGRQKLAAAQARRHPNATAEKPRAAIFEALHVVEAAIAGDGFVFVPSAPKFVRRNGDLTFEIRIQSDRNNIAGQRAAIWVHIGILSKSLTIWRKKHASDWIRPKIAFPLPFYGTQLGYLCDPVEWKDWNFADTEARRAVVDDLISSIKLGAYARFAIFEGPIEGVAAVSDHGWPPPEGILEFLLARGELGLATQTLQNYLNEHPAFRQNFESCFRRFQKQGLPSYRTALHHDLAAFAVATGYPWNEPDSIRR